MPAVKQQTNTEEIDNGFFPNLLEKGFTKIMDFGNEAANDDSVEERLEKGVKYTSRLERKKYANNVIPLNGLEARVDTHIETDRETDQLAMEVAKKNGKNKPMLVVSNEVETVVSVLEDEKKLEKLNKDAEKLEQYFETHRETENLTIEERKAKFKAFVNHYTEEAKDVTGKNTGHRKMKSFRSVLKDNWKTKEGIFNFLGRSIKDFFAYRVVRRGLESWNAGIDIKNKYEDSIRSGMAKVKKGTDKVKLGLTAKKEAKIHTAGLYLAGLESIKKFITLPTKKNRTAVMKFLEKYPKEGAKVFKDLGMPLKGLATKARKTEAFARIFDWIFHPEKQNESFLETAGGIALDVAPITGSYRDIKELFNDDSEYSFGTRALFAGTSVVMDGIWLAGTFFSGGSASVPLGAMRATARAALKGGAKKIVGSGAIKGAIKSVPKMSFKSYVKKLPESAKKYVFGKESAFLALFLLSDNAASLFWEKYNPVLKSYTELAVTKKIEETLSPQQLKLMHFAQRNLT